MFTVKIFIGFNLAHMPASHYQMEIWHLAQRISQMDDVQRGAQH